MDTSTFTSAMAALHAVARAIGNIAARKPRDRDLQVVVENLRKVVDVVSDLATNNKELVSIIREINARVVRLERRRRPKK